MINKIGLPKLSWPLSSIKSAPSYPSEDFSLSYNFWLTGLYSNLLRGKSLIIYFKSIVKGY